MRKPNLLLLLIVLIIAGIGALLYRTQFQGRSAETTMLPEGLGTAVAEATVQLLAGQGKVVLILPKRGSYQDPAVELQRAAFAKALAKTKGLSLVATESLETERPGTMGAGGLDAGEFRQLIERHAGADAFVSLAGVPEMPKDALTAWQGKKFIVVGHTGPQLKALLLAGLVQVAILPRTSPAAPGVKAPGTAREWFNATFETFTPANAATLP